MSTQKIQWNKNELQVYILLLCANADCDETDDEIKLIRSKVDAETFDRIYNEFCNDNEDESFEKIEESINQHEYSYREISQLKREMHDIFFSDKHYNMMERNLDRILDNMMY